MKKMIGIVMMGIGLILLVSGYFVYGNKEADLAKEEIEGQIQAVIADGIFTNREMEHIGELAEKYNLDKEDLFAKINERIAGNEDDAETVIIDQNKKKGDDFEKYIVKKFNRDYFTIKQWAGDKYVDGIFSEKTQQPDLILEFNHKEYSKKIAVECKYRSKIENGRINFSYKEQLERYKNFEEKENTDVYVAIGVGGKASNPDALYLIPLRELKNSFIEAKDLKKYEKPVDSYFFFNKMSKELGEFSLHSLCHKNDRRF